MDDAETRLMVFVVVMILIIIGMVAVISFDFNARIGAIEQTLEAVNEPR